MTLGALLLGLTAVAAPPSEADAPVLQIVNGETASAPRAVAALVAIDAQGMGGVFCSATLLAPRQALTAAHCVDSMTSTYAEHDIYLYFNTDVFGEAPDGVAVASAARHPDWDPQGVRHDIAVLQLAAPRADIAPIALNDEPVTEAWIGADLSFVGFGVTRDGGADAGLRRRATLDLAGCVEGSSTQLRACADGASNVIFAQRTSVNICEGDSGGPALEAVGDGWEIVGVSSFVSPRCVGGGAGATRVDRYVPWILTQAPEAHLDEGEIGEPGDTALGEPSRPPPGAYERPFFGLCATSGAGAGTGWGLLLALALVRRGGRPRTSDA